ncbi:hypothetical protein QIA41_04985 (plasmid) [Borreliella sinica]
MGGGAVLGTQVLGGILVLTGYIIGGTSTGPAQAITRATLTHKTFS